MKITKCTIHVANEAAMIQAVKELIQDNWTVDAGRCDVHGLDWSFPMILAYKMGETPRCIRPNEMAADMSYQSRTQANRVAANIIDLATILLANEVESKLKSLIADAEAEAGNIINEHGEGLMTQSPETWSVLESEWAIFTRGQFESFHSKCADDTQFSRVLASPVSPVSSNPCDSNSSQALRVLTPTFTGSLTLPVDPKLVEPKPVDSAPITSDTVISRVNINGQAPVALLIRPDGQFIVEYGLSRELWGSEEGARIAFSGAIHHALECTGWFKSEETEPDSDLTS